MHPPNFKILYAIFAPVLLGAVVLAVMTISFADVSTLHDHKSMEAGYAEAANLQPIASAPGTQLRVWTWTISSGPGWTETLLGYVIDYEGVTAYRLEAPHYGSFVVKKVVRASPTVARDFLALAPELRPLGSDPESPACSQDERRDSVEGVIDGDVFTFWPKPSCPDERAVVRDLYNLIASTPEIDLNR